MAPARLASASTALLLTASSALPPFEAALQYKIRVRNLTYLQPFSPVALFAHTEVLQAFQVGQESSPQFRALAEDGDLSDFMALTADEGVEPFLCGFTFGEDDLAPGGERWYTLQVNEKTCSDGAFFTMASMLVNTNDAFVGIDTLALERKRSTTVYPPVYDAGTEENNELCSHIPGPACDDTAGNLPTESGEGFVQVHRGFHGIGGELSADDYDWRNPVAEVYISKPTRV